MVQLIVYADRLGADLRELKSILDQELNGLFKGVHLLPFYYPINGADAGFDPVDHTHVDPVIGDWSDVLEIANDYSVTADLILNHMSVASLEFQDVRHLGEDSEFWDLFLKRGDVFGSNRDPAEGTGVAAIYRPRPGPPFTEIALDDGEVYEFWTTFSPQQLDINVESHAGQSYLKNIISRFSQTGIRQIRLDAAGYAIKRAGTSCFMLPETFEFIHSLATHASDLGMRSLVEIHSHYETQLAIAEKVDRVYDFALPPLVLHTLFSSDAKALKQWLKISPRNCVTVLDTHDGIGILDVSRKEDAPGLLGDDEVTRLVDMIHTKTGGSSARASGHGSSNLDVYQVNSTYYDALGRSDTDYLIARALQLFSPGTPQIYYVGLLAGCNDVELVDRTGVGRDINRHYYSRDEVKSALRRPVVQKLVDLITLRNNTPVFEGVFSIPECQDSQIVLRWETEDDFSELFVDLVARTAKVTSLVRGKHVTTIL